jgi:hypothetical protein
LCKDLDAGADFSLQEDVAMIQESRRDALRQCGLCHIDQVAGLDERLSMLERFPLVIVARLASV